MESNVEYDLCDACGTHTLDVEFLPCTHVVCVHCFEEAAVSGESDTGCIICDTETVRTKHTVHHQLPRCNLCTDNVYAISFCSNCSVHLCEFCEQAHRRQRQTSGHSLVGFHHELTVEQDSSLTDARLPSCSHFNSVENGKFFCDDCFVCVCQNCKEMQHVEHHIVTMKDLDIHCFEKLQNLLSKTQPLVSTLKDSVHTMEVLLCNIENRTSQIGEDICHVIDTHIASLEEHRMALLAELNQIKNHKISVLSQQLESLSKALDSIHSCCSQTSQVLSPGNEGLKSYSTKLLLANRLQELTDVRYEYRPQADDYVHFLSHSPAGYRKGYKMHGVLDIQNPSPYHSLISRGDGFMAKQRRPVAHKLIVVDKEGVRKLMGGDYVEFRVQEPSGLLIKTDIIDEEDGSYELAFTPDTPGDHRLSVLLNSKHVRGSPFVVYVSPRRKHKGRFHCCSFCSTEGKMKFPCACGGIMPGEGDNGGCGHSHEGHPGCWHWSCCGSVEENSDCTL